MADQWQNAFDLGECTVTLNDWTGSAGGAELFSAVLGKGDSHAGTHDTYGAYTLAVSADGVVSLEFSADGGDSVNGGSFEVLVTPSYAHDFPARISGMTSDAAAGQVNWCYGEINVTSFTDGADFLDYDEQTDSGGNPSSFLPDPLDMSALTGTRDLIGVYFVTTGVG